MAVTFAVWYPVDISHRLEYLAMKIRLQRTTESGSKRFIEFEGIIKTSFPPSEKLSPRGEAKRKEMGIPDDKDHLDYNFIASFEDWLNASGLAWMTVSAR